MQKRIKNATEFTPEPVNKNVTAQAVRSPPIAASEIGGSNLDKNGTVLDYFGTVLDKKGNTLDKFGGVSAQFGNTKTKENAVFRP